jgi:hypothetical protein
MKKMDQNLTPRGVDAGRRRFMTGVASVGAAAGLGLGHVAAHAAPAEQTAQASKPAGYHETDHIRRYYRSAREI